jgi:hypothetical protein
MEVDRQADPTDKSDTADLKQTELVWKNARRRAPKDGRLDYAWALALWKHGKVREAETYFRTSAAKSRPAWYPARRALVWLEFAQGRNGEGLDALDALIRDVASMKSADAEPAEVRELGEFIGRSLAALAKLKPSPEEEARRKAVLRNAQRRFSRELLTAMDDGRRAIEKRHDELQFEKLKTRLAVQKRVEKTKKAKSEGIAERKEAAEGSRESLKLTAEQAKVALEKQVETTKSGLDRIVKELTLLEMRRQSLSRSYLVSVRERNFLFATNPNLEREMRTPTAQPRGAKLAALILDQDIAKSQAAYLQTTVQMTNLRKTAAGLVQQYRAAVRSYEQITGRIARKSAAIDNFEKRLKNQEEKLKAEKIGDAVAVKLMKNRLQQFATYIPFDVDAEAKRLLNSYHR